MESLCVVSKSVFRSFMARHVWASYRIRKIVGCACAGNAGKCFRRYRLKRKRLVSDPGVHHGTCVTHVPWCMSGSLARGGGGDVPGIPGACATRNFAYLARGQWRKYQWYVIMVPLWKNLCQKCRAFTTTSHHKVDDIGILEWFVCYSSSEFIGVVDNLFGCFYCFTYIFMPHNMMILCFRLPHFSMSQIVLHFLYSTSVLSFYIDVILTLSSGKYVLDSLLNIDFQIIFVL